MVGKYTPMRILAASVGLAVIGADTTLNVANQVSKTGTVYDPVVLSTVVVAVGTSIGCMVALACFQSRSWSDRFLGLMVVMGIVVGGMFTFGQSIERVSMQRMAFLSERASNEEVRRKKYDANLLQAARIDDEIKMLAVKVERECYGPIDYDPRIHNASNFPKCHPAYVQLQELRAERNGYMRAAQSQQVALWEVDEAAQALALSLPFSAETISLYKQWLLPLALVFFGFGLFTWGTAGERPEFGLDPVIAAKQKAERYVESYVQQSGGKKPTLKQIMEHSGVTNSVAKAVRMSA